MDEQIIGKRCTRCGKEKPATVEFFPARKQRPDGLDSWCRECYRIKSTRWNAGNRARKAATDKLWRETNSTEYAARRHERYARLSVDAKTRRRETARKHNDKLKREAMEHYGGAFCSCCGETEILMLALDHISNDGAEHRKSLTGSTRKLPTSAYIWAKRNNWPPIFQVTCFNCNWARHWNDGVCPHTSTLIKPLRLVS